MFKKLLVKITGIFSKDKEQEKPITAQDAMPFPSISKAKVKSQKRKTAYPKKKPAKTAKKLPPKKKSVEQKPKEKQPTWKISEFKVEKTEGKLRFHDLPISDSIMHGIFDLNFKYCSPIQAGILPESLKGKDVTGKAQTGTGKTAAFLITILSRLLIGGKPKYKKARPIRALILAPTRELAIQIEKEAKALGKYTGLNVLAVYGGTGYEKQRQVLARRNTDIVVATPGRLIDFKQKKAVHLDKAEIVVLDEADRMLDMGFIPDVRNIIYSTPPKDKRQTMFFSATLTPEISNLTNQWTKNPVSIEIEPEQVASDNINQVIYIVTMQEKFNLLYNLITKKKLEKVIIFVNRRDQTRYLHEKLQQHGIKTALLSGEVSQVKREKALESFKNGKITALVATDVAARGIHVDDVSHVVNYTLPTDPEHYVHRIGRTGRAGMKGVAISCACEEDSFHIPDIEKFIGRKLDCEYPDDKYLVTPPKPKKQAQRSGVKKTHNRHQQRRTRPHTRRPSKGKPQGRRVDGKDKREQKR
ncbi:MAG: DEAD/DEAH box helicase [Desulfobacterales bacterium]|nr:DEAD/DEAH box helicase [Desulfobacterales bacterium]MCP4158722.1 DEAD/DEAH box helicase [Deltaproteobacteria bacterium]